VPYHKIVKQANKIFKKRGEKKCKIFIATDEQSFLDYMLNKYGDLVSYRNVQRSFNGKSLHLQNNEPYQQGLELIIDTVLLSRGNYLIRNSSNLSRWSTFFNPHMSVYELNKLSCHKFINDEISYLL